MQHKLGFIGLGMMGHPMAKRLSKAGSQFAVFNRTRSKAESLLPEEAQWCETPSIIASRSDIVFSMVSNPDALRDIALGPDGVLAGLKSGGIHIDTSTVSPSITRDLTAQYTGRGCFFLHAPILGSIPQATDGTLLMFAGGDAAAYRRNDHDARSGLDLCREGECRSADDARHHWSVAAKLADVSNKRSFNSAE